MKNPNKNFGIGVDTEKISSFKKFNDRNSPFLRRVFTKKELDYCFSKTNYAQHLAARYVGKEALIKAISNIRQIDSFDFATIEILNNKKGAPKAILKKKELKTVKTYISLSHDRERAIALALVLKNEINMPLSSELMFSVLLSNNRIEKSDAIILLQGDGYSRVSESIFLYERNFADKIVVSGAVREEYDGVSSNKLRQRLIERGIPFQKIVLEDKSLNTRDQAVEVMKLVKSYKWKKIILVTSHFHQFRAFLTFLKAMRQANMEIKIFVSPVRSLDWFKEPTEWGPTRAELLEAEFDKITKYKNDVATFQEGIDYLKWIMRG